MASSFERDVSDSVDIDGKLNNVQLRLNCDIVCEKLKIRDVCSNSAQQNCLVPYPYGMTLGETYAVAVQAGFEEKLLAARELESSALTRSGSALTEAVEVEEGPKPLAPFKPDWRFWTGVTFAGVGLFLHRSR